MTQKYETSLHSDRKEVVFHLGLPKTGTTSLQARLNGYEWVIKGHHAESLFSDGVSLERKTAFALRFGGFSRIFISYEEVIFGALRPARISGVVSVCSDWKRRVKSAVEVISVLFPHHRLRLVYSVRDFNTWCLSAFSQNYDSHYWLHEITYSEFQKAIMEGAPEIVSAMRGNLGPFKERLADLGEVKCMPVSDILRDLGIPERKNVSKQDRENRRFVVCGENRYRLSKPITFGHVLAKYLRRRLRARSLSRVYRIAVYILSCPPFRNLRVGYFLVDTSGASEFRWKLGFVAKSYDGQPNGLIS